MLDYKRILLLMTIGLASSCSQVFEDDITHDKVTILSPSDDAYISSSKFTFQWKELSGATNYQIEIDEVNMINNQEYTSNKWDSLAAGNRVSVAIDAFTAGGKEYLFKIKALNSAFETDFSSVRFTRSTDLDLSDQTVTLSKPENSDTSDVLSVVFEWEPIAGVPSYLFYITDALGNTIDGPFTVSTTNYNYTFSENNTQYYWLVKAQNTTSISKKQAPIWSVKIDTSITK